MATLNTPVELIVEKLLRDGLILPLEVVNEIAENHNENQLENAFLNHYDSEAGS